MLCRHCVLLLASPLLGLVQLFCSDVPLRFFLMLPCTTFRGAFFSVLLTSSSMARCLCYHANLLRVVQGRSVVGRPVTARSRSRSRPKVALLGWLLLSCGEPVCMSAGALLLHGLELGLLLFHAAYGAVFLCCNMALCRFCSVFRCYRISRGSV
jgi:hypothetical protein